MIFETKETRLSGSYLQYDRSTPSAFWSWRTAITGPTLLPQETGACQEGANIGMMPSEIIAKFRMEELWQEARQAQLLHQVPRPPSRLGMRVRNLLRKLTVPSVAINDGLGNELLWPRLSDYPYGPRRQK